MFKRDQGGLTSLSDEQLKVILKKVYTQELTCPFGRADLLMRGLNAVAEEGDILFGLDEPGVRAVISAVFAERRSTAQHILKLRAKSETIASRGGEV